MKTRRDPIERSVIERARELRRHPAATERTAWRLLRGRRLFGLKFRRQHPIGPVVVDFYCAELHLVLEIDGPIHDKAINASYDRARTCWPEARGLRIVRVLPGDMSEFRLRSALQPLLPHRPPSPHRGEGVRG